MLDLDQLRDIFVRFTYLPGWRWVVWIDQYEGPHLTITAQLPDAYHPGQVVDLAIHSPLPPFADEEQVKAWFSWRLARIATHESREYLRYEGKLVSDPHAVGART